jgi:DNA-binding GntR family transcriptional regulator
MPVSEVFVAPLRPRGRRMRPTGMVKDRRQVPTASAVIRQDLRNDILALKLLPGQPIVEKEIAEAYGVSRTPVREAVLRLAEEGLIDIFPQSGTYVSRIPLQALPEALIIRRALEETSARMAATRSGPREIAAIEAVMDRLRETAASGDREQFHQSDDAFHAAIAEAAGYPGLWRVAQQVKVQVDRYRRLTLPQEGRLERVLIEHDAVLDAIRRRDAGDAAHHMGHHLGSLMADIGDVAGLNPDYFDFGDSASPRPNEELTTPKSTLETK